MDTTNYSEKRAYLRYSVGIKAGYVEDCAHSEIPTVTSNICEEGLCIVTKRLLLPGTDIDVVLRIKGNPEEIRRHGKVVWCKIAKPGEYYSGEHHNHTKYLPYGKEAQYKSRRMIRLPYKFYKKPE